MQVNVYFLSALAGVLTAVVAAYTWLMTKQRSLISAQVEISVRKVMDEMVDPIDKRVSVLETKIEVFWQSVARDVAGILHHPEPSRFRVDELLDTLVAGTMTQEECAELKEYLKVIRDWSPDDNKKEPPFKIFAGEQVAAAILLHTMNHLIDGKE